MKKFGWRLLHMQSSCSAKVREGSCKKEHCALCAQECVPIRVRGEFLDLISDEYDAYEKLLRECVRAYQDVREPKESVRASGPTIRWRMRWMVGYCKQEAGKPAYCQNTTVYGICDTCLMYVEDKPLSYGIPEFLAKRMEKVWLKMVK